jgi:hypothetical protein
VTEIKGDMNLQFLQRKSAKARPEYCLAANPHLYDYLHQLCFRENGTVELLHGSGQFLRTRAIGQYAINEVNETTALVKFFDVIP